MDFFEIRSFLRRFFLLAVVGAFTFFVLPHGASALTVTKEFGNHPNATNVFDFGQPVTVTKIRLQTMWGWEDGSTIGVSSVGIGKNEAQSHFSLYAPGDGWLGMNQLPGVPPSGAWYDSTFPCPDGACQLAITPGLTGLMAYGFKDDGGSGAVAPVECRNYNLSSVPGNPPDSATFDYCFGITGYAVSGNAVNLTWYGVTNRDIGGTFTRIMIDANPAPPATVPTGLSSQCPAPGTQATLSWSPAANATRYGLRVDNIANPWNGSCTAPNAGDICNDNAAGTTFTFPSTAGASYNWWVHGINAGGAFSPAATGNQFTCIGATPPPTTPTNLAASCSALGTPVTLSWSPAQNATRYGLRVDNITNPWNGSCTAPNAGDICNDNVTGTSFTVSTTAGARYNWWVHGIDAGGTFSPAATGKQFPCDGTIRVRGTINGVMLNPNSTDPVLGWKGPVNGQITLATGQTQPITFNIPAAFPGSYPGHYTGTFISGAPPDTYFHDVNGKGTTVAGGGTSGTASVDLAPGGTAEFVLNYTAPSVRINATLNGKPVNTTFAVNAATPKGSFPNMTVIAPLELKYQSLGTYTYQYVSGSPPGAIFKNVTPSDTQTITDITQAGSKTFTFNFVSPPPTPTALQAVCKPQESQVTLSWSASPGATAYFPRVDDTVNNASSCTDGWYCKDPPDTYRDNYTSTSLTIPIIPGDAYEWWVHAGNSDGLSPEARGKFRCQPPILICPEGTVNENEVCVCPPGTVAVGETTSIPPVPICASLPTLSVGLSADRVSGTGTLTDVDLTAVVSGTASGPINYTFYCNRSDQGIDVTPGWDAKFDGVSETTKTATDVCDYPAPGTYTAKVIAERDGAPPATALRTITVTPEDEQEGFAVSCSVSPATARVGQDVTWSAAVTGGSGGPYSYQWSGDAPLEGKTGQSVTIAYTSSGTKHGEVTASVGGGENAPPQNSFSNLPPFLQFLFRFLGLGGSQEGGNQGGDQSVTSVCTNSAIIVPLAVSLTADPASGAAPLTDVDLTAIVTGTTGSVTYTFYCNRSDAGTNVTAGWDAQFTNLSATTKTAADLCTYSQAGSYTAKVIAESGGASVEARAQVTAAAPPAVALSADPPKIVKGKSSTLSWTSTDATACSLNQGIGAVAVNGTTTVSPQATTVYTITCSGPGGAAVDSATVTVTKSGGFEEIPPD